MVRWMVPISVVLLCGVVACSPVPSDDISLAEPDLGDLDPALRARIDAERERVAILDSGAEVADTDRAEAYGQLGRLYHAHDLFDAAIPAYERAAELDPTAARWPYYLGRIALERGEPKAAVSLLESALNLDPEYAPSLLALGRAHHEAGDLVAAYDVLRDATKLEPSAEGYFRMAQMEVEKGQAQASIKRFRRALELQEDAEPVRRALASAYRALGQDEEAKAVLEGASERGIVTHDPWLSEVQALAQNDASDRAARLFEQGRFREAAELLKEAVAAQPDDATVRMNLGAALVRAGQPELARSELETAVRLDPEVPRTHFNLGTLLVSMQDDPAAIERFESALALDPAFLAAHFNLANAHLRQGDFEEAAEHFSAVVTEQSANRDARYGEAVALTQAGEEQRAESRLREGLAALPDDARLTHALARLLAAGSDAAVRNGAEARILAESLIRSESGVAHIETLAMAHAELGDFRVCGPLADTGCGRDDRTRADRSPRAPRSQPPSVRARSTLPPGVA